VNSEPMNARDVFKEIRVLISQVLKENPHKVDKHGKGKEQVSGFFVGQVMKKTRERQTPK